MEDSMKIMETVANGNLNWYLARTPEGVWENRYVISTFLDYPEAWYGCLRPASEYGKWEYEIRARRSGSTLASGKGSWLECFRFVNSKR